MRSTWMHAINQTLIGDLVPRNPSGVAQSIAGALGTVFYPFKKMFIVAGEYGPGDIIWAYDFAGMIPPGQGWMKMDGRIVSEANYDAEHGAGSWAEYAAASPLVGKYLPNMTGKYLIGTSGSTQNGLVPITYAGNPAHKVNLAHTHTAINVSTVARSGTNYFSMDNTAGFPDWDHNHSAVANSALSAEQVIQPESIAVRYYMRVI